MPGSQFQLFQSIPKVLDGVKVGLCITVCMQALSCWNRNQKNTKHLYKVGGMLLVQTVVSQHAGQDPTIYPQR